MNNWMVLANLVIGVAVLLTLIFVVLKELKEIKLMATASQALTDLQAMLTALVADVTAATTDIADLIEQVSALNGLNPTAVEAVVAQGNAALASLQASIANANNILNPSTVTISISPTTASLAPGATQQFTGTVSGNANTGVTYSCLTGSISQTGLYTASTTPGTDTVTAASQANPAKVATALVTVSAVVAPTITVSVSPTSAGPVAQGSTQLFTASVTGDPANAGVTWSLAPKAVGVSTGTINPTTGIYAPPTTPGGTDTVIATSVSAPTVTATATVTY
jgi:hypothetical protein